MKNLDEKRAREIADRLEEIRRETNSCSVHNTKPLSKERLLELYSEENELGIGSLNIHLLMNVIQKIPKSWMCG